jgi:transposase
MANPFDYLTELYRNAEDVAAHPDRWLPWNYRKAPLAVLANA